MNLYTFNSSNHYSYVAAMDDEPEMLNNKMCEQG